MRLDRAALQVRANAAEIWVQKHPTSERSDLRRLPVAQARPGCPDCGHSREEASMDDFGPWDD